MPGRLEGKVAVVTGSNSGIGRAVALAFGKEGAKVVCANRQAESKTDGEKDITTNDLVVKNGGEGIFMKLDFSNTESVDVLVKRVVEKYGRIDIWINNAGAAGGLGKQVWEWTDEEFDQAIDINLKGCFKCTRAAAAQMVKQDPGSGGLRGTIIHTGSVFGYRGFPTATPYAAAKMGMLGMMKCAAVDLAQHKITINTVCPGTTMTNATSGIPKEAHDWLRPKALLGYGKPDDLTGAFLLLASDEGKWFTGQEIFPDGGFMTT